MDMETLTNPGLYVFIALLAGIWFLGSHFERVAKRYKEKGLDPIEPDAPTNPKS